MKLLTAKPVIEARRPALVERVSKFRSKFGRAPHLAVVLIGEDPASQIYVSRKETQCALLGIDQQTLRFPSSVDPKLVARKVSELNLTDGVDGILIQRPLPPSFDDTKVSTWVDPRKDVDVFHPENFGKLALGIPGLKSCTPNGILLLLKHHQIPIRGKRICVVGRSRIVGRPAALLLEQEGGTVTVCHRSTVELEAETKRAEIVVVAAGRKHLLNQGSFSSGATVIDVGMHRTDGGSVTGDVDPAGLDSKLAAFSPVPGGVGPLTIWSLMENTVTAAEQLRA